MCINKLSHSGNILTIDVESSHNLTEPFVAQCRIVDLENSIRIEDFKITLTKKNQRSENFVIKGGISIPKNTHFKFEPLQITQFEFKGSKRFLIANVWEFSATTKGHDHASNEVINVPLTKVYHCTKCVTGNDHECELEGRTKFVTEDKTSIRTKTVTIQNPEIVVVSLLAISLCLILATRKRLGTWISIMVSTSPTKTEQYRKLIESS